MIFREVIDIDNIELLLKLMFKELMSIVENDIRSNYIFYTDYFYQDYDPLYYHRLGNIVTHSGGLYSGLVIYNDDHILEWLIDDSLLPPHHQSNSIVAELNMRRGIHGGIQFIKGQMPPTTIPSIVQSMGDWWESYSGSTLYNKLFTLMPKYRNRFMSAVKEVGNIWQK